MQLIFRIIFVNKGDNNYYFFYSYRILYEYCIIGNNISKRNIAKLINSVF